MISETTISSINGRPKKLVSSVRLAAKSLLIPAQLASERSANEKYEIRSSE